MAEDKQPSYFAIIQGVVTVLMIIGLFSATFVALSGVVGFDLDQFGESGAYLLSPKQKTDQKELDRCTKHQKIPSLVEAVNFFASSKTNETAKIEEMRDMISGHTRVFEALQKTYTDSLSYNRRITCVFVVLIVAFTICIGWQYIYFKSREKRAELLFEKMTVTIESAGKNLLSYVVVGQAKMSKELKALLKKSDFKK